VFIAHGQAKDDFKDVPEGVIINSSSDDETEPVRGNEREVSLSPSIFAPGADSGTATSPASGGTPPAGSMVHITPLGGKRNVNPAMNESGSMEDRVQVMSALIAQSSGISAAETGLLEGIPGGMFDWGECELHLALWGADIHNRTMGHLFLSVWRERRE
jgi:hypothetical protein